MMRWLGGAAHGATVLISTLAFACSGSVDDDIDTPSDPGESREEPSGSWHVGHGMSQGMPPELLEQATPEEERPSGQWMISHSISQGALAGQGLITLRARDLETGEAIQDVTACTVPGFTCAEGDAEGRLHVAGAVGDWTLVATNAQGYPVSLIAIVGTSEPVDLAPFAYGLTSFEVLDRLHAEAGVEPDASAGTVVVQLVGASDTRLVTTDGVGSAGTQGVRIGDSVYFFNVRAGQRAIAIETAGCDLLEAAGWQNTDGTVAVHVEPGAVTHAGIVTCE